MPSPTSRRTLIERAHELRALEGAVERLAHDRRGGAVAILAPAGLGKSTLLDHAADAAAAADIGVLRAAPGPLESVLPLGAIRALLETTVRRHAASAPDRRAALVTGAAAPAAALLLDGDDRAPVPALAHATLWLCAALAAERPIALLVDDAEGADPASRAVLAYLARRAHELPVLVVVAAREDVLGGAAPALRPAPLSPAGVAELLPGLSEDRARRVHATTGGAPWLLCELARRGGADAAAPSTALRATVRRRLASLSRDEHDLAAALALATAPMPAAVLSAITGLDAAALAAARDALAAAGLTAPSGARLVHPRVARAIAEDLSPGARRALHDRAARALLAEGAEEDHVAHHVLRGPPSGDAELSALLQRAAARAARRGASARAVAMLRRALDERAPGDDPGALLVALAEADADGDGGVDPARGRLAEALRRTDAPAVRAAALTLLAHLELGRTPADARALVAQIDAEVVATEDEDARDALQVAALDALLASPERHHERVRRLMRLDAGRPVLREVALAHRAWVAAERGTLDAGRTAALATGALAHGTLQAEAHRRGAFGLAVRALAIADRTDDAAGAIAAFRADAVARGAVRRQAEAAALAADVALRRGRVADAEREARTALRLSDGGEDLDLVTGGALEVLVIALVERGEIAAARTLLEAHGLDGALGGRPWDAGLLHARARLALAEGDLAAAHADACEAGVLRDGQGRPNPAGMPWRSTAALALAQSGRIKEAVVLADAELAQAERYGARAAIVAALHARTVAEPDPRARIVLCERALGLAERSDALLELTRIRAELGAALRRVGQRTEARVPLRRALADADALGATTVAERCRRELIATGLRPRRAQTEGAAALTPRQREVCDLAAAGIPNRAIAERLFLSVKTVETHLAAAYRKLGVATRDQLRAALETSPPAPRDPGEPRPPTAPPPRDRVVAAARTAEARR